MSLNKQAVDLRMSTDLEAMTAYADAMGAEGETEMERMVRSLIALRR